MTCAPLLVVSFMSNLCNNRSSISHFCLYPWWLLLLCFREDWLKIFGFIFLANYKIVKCFWSQFSLCLCDLYFYVCGPFEDKFFLSNYLNATLWLDIRSGISWGTAVRCCGDWHPWDHSYTLSDIDGMFSPCVPIKPW